ncbi:DUF2478 domain-containing protein [Lutimaribacter marinistellae]|uniref:DUF2478 domain-containing protein n=1 Tax=Lutimaribacter marinistellae TaxID=1820329 RepID=A0ABV7TKE0_9RHOB
MQLAYTMAPGRGDTDLLLFRLAKALTKAGVRTAGTVQINSESPSGGPCDMDVQVLPDGQVFRISQSLGTGSRGCRLDPTALESAVGYVQKALDVGADCLIINKFGKQEADGRGFRPVIAEALTRGIPVLVGVNALNLSAFNYFAGGLAQDLRPELTALEAWAHRSLEIKCEAA